MKSKRSQILGFLTGFAFMAGVSVFAGATFSRVTTWKSGQTLTAAALNTEFNYILSNLTPDGIDDYSSDTTEMRSVSDPYTGSTEVQATALSGEIQQLRYQILEIKKALQASNVTYWYQDLPTAGVFTIAGSSVGVNDTTPDYAFDVEGTAGVSGNLTVGGNILISGSLSGTEGNIEISTITTTADAVRISSHTNISGDVDITGTLTGVAGDFSGAFDAAGEITENTNRVFSNSSMAESSALTIVANSTHTLTHGLGGTPRLYYAVLVNVTGEHGYATGDEVLLPSTNYGGDGFSGAVWANSTTVNYTCGSQISIARRDAAAITNITTGNWKLKLRAWY
jgi:hypothetical protein